MRIKNPTLISRKLTEVYEVDVDGTKVTATYTYDMDNEQSGGWVYDLEPCYVDLDEEEIEYALTLVAAEDALELATPDASGAYVLAFEIPESAISSRHDMSVSLNSALTWQNLQCMFAVDDNGEDLTWYAPQEIEPTLTELKR